MEASAIAVLEGAAVEVGLGGFAEPEGVELPVVLAEGGTVASLLAAGVDCLEASTAGVDVELEEGSGASLAAGAGFSVGGLDIVASEAEAVAGCWASPFDPSLGSSATTGCSPPELGMTSIASFVVGAVGPELMANRGWQDDGRTHQGNSSLNSQGGESLRSTFLLFSSLRV
jgi:hypothetical protein